MSKVYLFSVGPDTPPLMTVDPGAEFTVEVEGAFDDIDDITTVPTPFTPESEGHPLAPITGPIEVRGAEPGDAVVIELRRITPHGVGRNAILRAFGVLREEFPDPRIIACPIRDGMVWFGDRIPVAIEPNLGTVSTMPPAGYKPAYAGAYGGDLDQRHVEAGSRLHLPVLMPGAGVFFADPHAAIKDGIVSGTGIECAVTLEASIELDKGRAVARPLIERADSIQVVGFGETVEAATEDATRHAVDYLARTTDLGREQAYMLLGAIGDLRVGTSPRPVMAARLIIPRAPLAAAGWTGAAG